MTNKRFFIEYNGIIDNWKSTNKGNCEDKLSWSEHCDTLNQLDKLADENLDEYKLIVELESEVQHLKLKLAGLGAFVVKMKKDLEDIGVIIDA